MYAIEAQNVTKIIRGRTILNNVSLCVEQGEAVGIAGRNGSGKSMFFKTVCGLILPTSGSVSVFGTAVGKNGKFAPDTGMLIEAPGFLPQYSGYANLKMLADIKGIVKKADIYNVLQTVGLDPADRRPVRKYSLGMKQRLGIAQAIMEKPRLLIMDEPFNGLDASGVEDVRQLLSSLVKEGTTMLLASHNAQDLSLLCGRICTMEAGVLTLPQPEDEKPAQENCAAAQGTADEVRAEAAQSTADAVRNGEEK